jgi:hypothetical protein
MENHHYIPIKTGYKKIVLGSFCNDSGKWVDDMNYCPVIYSQANYREVVPKQKWKIRKDGDIRNTQEILHIGQQKLRL